MANTPVTLTVDLTDKSINASGLLAKYEDVSVTLSLGVGTYDENSLILRVFDPDANILALTSGVWTKSGTTYTDTLDLNTTEMVDYFAGAANQAVLPLTVEVWDTSVSAQICNSIIEFINSPWSVGTPGPTTVGQTYLLAVPEGGNWRLIGSNICFWDMGWQQWRPFFLNNGASAPGAGIDD